MSATVNGNYMGTPMATNNGFRGGYGPFYDAVVELSRRGAFDAGEVDTRPGEAARTHAATTKDRRDEYAIPFPVGTYAVCKFRRIGTDQITVACDGEGELYIEQFHVWYDPFIEQTGVGRLVIRANQILLYVGNTRIERETTITLGRGPNATTEIHTGKRGFVAAGANCAAIGGTNTNNPAAIDNNRVYRRAVCTPKAEVRPEATGAPDVGHRRLYTRTKLYT